MPHWIRNSNVNWDKKCQQDQKENKKSNRQIEKLRNRLKESQPSFLEVFGKK
jgi:DNA-binding transcriptional regulator YiaG